MFRNSSGQSLVAELAAQNIPGFMRSARFREVSEETCAGAKRQYNTHEVSAETSRLADRGPAFGSLET